MRPKINYAGPWITEYEAEAVKAAVLGGFYQNYRVHAQRLEQKLTDFLGVRHVLATNSCTAALHLAVASLGLKAGDEVITTDSSCVASGMPIAFCGATPVFVDVDPESWLLAPSAIRRAITPRTRAILVVHWNGHPCAMEEILAIAREHNLRVIEDGAPALGAEYRGRKVGTLGDIGCFSFQGAKVAIGGQGGAFVTNHPELHARAECLASYGRTDSVMQYWSDSLGWNYTMPNLPAALAAAQMDRLTDLIARKRQIFAWYQEGLAGVEAVKLIPEPEGTRSTCCYPPMLLRETASIDRAHLFAELKKDNIDARPAQPRMSRMPMFECRFPNPESERVERQGVILPSAFNLTEEDVRFVCQRIRELVS